MTAPLPTSFDYATLQKTYGNGIPCPPDFSFPHSVIDSWATKQPAAPAILWVSHDFKDERTVTYRQLSEESHKAAKVFQEHGIKKGDRVLLQLPRVVEWWFAAFGLMRIGAIPCPGTSLLVAKDLKFRASASNAVAFVGDVEACGRFDEVAPDVGVKLVFQIRTAGDGGLGKGRIDFQSALRAVKDGTTCEIEHKSTDLALVYFTSGTTGNPKMVLLEAEYLLGHSISGVWYKTKPGSLFLCMADLGWAKASYGSMGTFNMGSCYFVQPPPPGPFDPSHLLDALHRYPIEGICAPPTVYRAMVSSSALSYYRSHPFKALTHCVGAGEPLNASVIKQWRDETGITIRDGWGQTESVIMVGNFDGIEVREGSMGKAAPFFEIGIIGPNGEELPVGEEGELAVRCDEGGGSCWIFKGYVKNGKIDKRQKSHGGKVWYCTGDRGIKDKDDYFWFVGRDDDVITSSGYRIGPFEVESALKSHPAVAESAAVGSPDVARGEIVKSFVVLADEYRDRASGTKAQELIAELQSHFKRTTAPYKAPREIEFVEALPKTISGKIRRIELRELEKQRKADVVKAQRAKL
ncbi:hypothetical protein JCM1841_000781 [Sporobolomyces salmonicolor]